jgi:hypothetical protein
MEQQMIAIPQRLQTQSHDWLARRVIALENALEQCSADRDEISAAYTSLSKLVMQRDAELHAQHMAAMAAKEETK